MLNKMSAHYMKAFEKVVEKQVKVEDMSIFSSIVLLNDPPT